MSFNGSDIENPAGFFTYDGKHNFNSKFAGTYNGMTFVSGLKMEGTTNVSFTTEAVGTVTIVQSTWSDYTIKLDGTELDLQSATTPAGSTGVRVYQQAIAAGSHSVTRGNGESGLFYIEVKTGGGSTSINAPKNMVLSRRFYNLQGQLIEKPNSGAYISVDRYADGTTTSRKVIR